MFQISTRPVADAKRAPGIVNNTTFTGCGLKPDIVPLPRPYYSHVMEQGPTFKV